jgi:Flp pilus assembly protein TadB
VAVILALAFALGWSMMPGSRPPQARLDEVVGPVRPGVVHRSGARTWIENSRVRGVVCAVGCGLVSMTVLGSWWAIVGASVGLALSWWLGNLEAPSVVRRRERTVRDLPVAADLLAACARAGQPWDRSLSVVSHAIGGPISHEFRRLEARLRLGSDPSAEWRRLAADPQLAPLARAILRSLESGAPIVETLERLADDRRRELRTQNLLRARSVGVKSAGPLAGCFLPAFMLVGVVPTVAGGFAHLVL